MASSERTEATDLAASEAPRANAAAAASGARAAQHSDLARRYLGMARDLAAAREDKTACQKILAAMIDISGDEPPVYTVAKEPAHNLAIQGLGRDVAAMVSVPFSKRMRAHVCRFDSV
jgi:hypothetical protein